MRPRGLSLLVDDYDDDDYSEIIPPGIFKELSGMVPGPWMNEAIEHLIIPGSLLLIKLNPFTPAKRQRVRFPISGNSSKFIGSGISPPALVRTTKELLYIKMADLINQP